MIKKPVLTAETYSTLDELVRLAGIAVRNAQAESRRLGVPNVYSINGRLYYETPDGELSTTDPLEATSANATSDPQPADDEAT